MQSFDLECAAVVGWHSRTTVVFITAAARPYRLISTGLEVVGEPKTALKHTLKSIKKIDRFFLRIRVTPPRHTAD
jgi:hypothetical protein